MEPSFYNGEVVTVLIEGRPVVCDVKIMFLRRDQWGAETYAHQQPAVFDEGIKWARGEDTPAANALRAVAALSGVPWASRR